jgi:hypothetical protein
MRKWSRLLAAAQRHNGDLSKSSGKPKPSGSERESDGESSPASKTVPSSPSYESEQQTPTLRILAYRTVEDKTLFSEIDVDQDYPMPSEVIPMTDDDARRLIPRYTGMAQHDILQWHFSICPDCYQKGGNPCREYFEIIAEYAEYEGYAIRGEG